MKLHSCVTHARLNCTCTWAKPSVSAAIMKSFLNCLVRPGRWLTRRSLQTPCSVSVGWRVHQHYLAHGDPLKKSKLFDLFPDCSSAKVGLYFKVKVYALFLQTSAAFCHFKKQCDKGFNSAWKFSSNHLLSLLIFFAPKVAEVPVTVSPIYFFVAGDTNIHLHSDQQTISVLGSAQRPWFWLQKEAGGDKMEPT